MVDPRLTTHQTGVYSSVLWLIPDWPHIKQVFTAVCYGWSQTDHTSNRCLQQCAMVDPRLTTHQTGVFRGLCYGWSQIDYTSDRCLQHCAMVDLRLTTHQTGVYSTVLWLIPDWPHIRQVFTALCYGWSQTDHTSNRCLQQCYGWSQIDHTSDRCLQHCAMVDLRLTTHQTGVYSTVLWLIPDRRHIRQVFTALCYGWSQIDYTSNRCLQQCAMVDSRLTTHQTGVYSSVLWLIPDWPHIKQVFTAVCYGWSQIDYTSNRCFQRTVLWLISDWPHIRQVFTAVCYGWSKIDHTSDRCLQHCAMVDPRQKTHQTGVYSTVLWLISDWPHIRQVFTALCYGWSKIDHTSNRCLQHCAMVDLRLTTHQTGVYSTVLWLISDWLHIKQVFTALCYGWSKTDHTSNRCLQHCAMVDPRLTTHQTGVYSTVLWLISDWLHIKQVFTTLCYGWSQTDVTSNRCLQHCAMVDSRLTTHQTGVYSTVLWLIQTDHTSNRCLQHCAMVDPRLTTHQTGVYSNVLWLILFLKHKTYNTYLDDSHFIHSFTCNLLWKNLTPVTYVKYTE